MITVTKGQPTTVIYTAKELATLPNPFYLWVCTHRGTGNVISFVVSSTGNARYDVSSITVNGEEGMYEYRIYEQNNNINLGVSAAGKQVEKGYLYVKL